MSTKEVVGRKAETEENYDYRVIDFVRTIKVLYRNKLKIILTVLVFSSLGVLYSLLLPKIYKSDALLAPVSDSDSSQLDGLTSRLGGLASLAGVNLGSTDADKTTVALNTLRSRQFITNFIREHDLMVPLFAVKGWDEQSNEWLIDEEIYDVELKAWNKFYMDKNVKGPTDWMAYRLFYDYFYISQDSETGLVLLSVKSESPYFAQTVAELLIQDINNYMRKRDIDEANKSIAFLTAQLESTSVAEMRGMLFQLLQQQQRTIMLSEVRSEYVFKVLDKPMVPDSRFSPKRKVIVLLFTFFGLILSVVAFLLKESAIFKLMNEVE